jgi:glycosyltransferase involved in cell wall biosynthesis/CelD/BcsL family acetyltransferase involved in cellulose biosynthesis
MNLTVVSISYPLAPVGPDAAGGAEQVLHELDVALVRAGHRSIVIAPEGSRTAGALWPLVPPRGALDASARAAAQQRVRDALESVLRTERVDVVHLHGLDFAAYAPRTGVPVVVTVHLPPSWHAAADFAPGGPTFVCVSRTQQRAFGREARVIENGVDLERLRPSPHHAGFALALGRICEEKGFGDAIRAAELAGVPLLLGGRVFPYPEHERHFREELEPRLRPPHRFLGPVGAVRKRRLLAAARCLVVPSLAPETSSLVAMEALACGTPVIARLSGALPEIVQHGATGFLGETVEELARGIAAAPSLDRARCRAAAEERFSVRRMSASYLDMYRELAGRGAARPSLTPRVELVHGLPELTALRPAWCELWEASPRATAFQHPAWALPWARLHAPDGTFAVVVRRGSELQALLPLFRFPDGGRCIAAPLGGGHVDRHELLLGPGVDPGPLLRELARLPGDGVILDQLAPDSPLLAAGAADAATPCAVLDLAGPARPSPSLLHDVARARRRAEKEGLEIRWSHGAPQDVEELLALHGARWERRGQPGVLRELHAFLLAAAPELAGAGILRGLALHVGGRPLASVLGLAWKDTFAYYIGGFDPDRRALSPGSLCVAVAIESAVAEGRRYFDFLRGLEPYKARWGARPVEHRRVRIAGNGTRVLPAGRFAG